jgi:rod shape-determining protein MreD
VRILAAAVLLIFALVLQVTALPYYRIGRAAPDFPFLCLLYLAYFAPRRPLLLLAFLTGLAVDLISLDPVGTRFVGYLPPLWLANRVRRGFVAESPALRAVLTFVAALLAGSLEGGYLALREGRWLGLGGAFTNALYAALLGVAVFAALDLHRTRLGWARDRFF